MTLSLIEFFAGVVVLMAIAGWWSLRQGQPTAPVKPVGEEMAFLASQAVDAAHDVYDTDLNYSAESIEDVERILATLHGEHQSRAFYPERLAGEANRWGAYVGEVARRLEGGEWHRDSAHVGPRTYPLVWAGDHEIYPCAWCFRRLTNGPEDNVFVKFRLAVTERPSRSVR